MKKSCLLAAIAGLVAGVSLCAADYIWIEGESATKTNLSANPWVKGDNPKLLSGGDAFSCLNSKADLPNPGFVL